MRDIEYRTTVQDEHWRNEEFQWARVLAEGHAAKGMVLLYLQKACTAFHEFEPAFKAGALDPSRLDFFRRRLANRLGHLVTTMKNNDLDKLDGAPEIDDILHAVESAKSLEDLAELTDRLHSTGHTLLDALERA
ncbi:MAG TPA: hypothetical protein PKH24_05855 [Sedimentisphaerales bacterium]|jgi:hypothetical protein|nr:hypothetical protein [Sedimentisphaerales bacterium]HNU29109.1 hypothetical protein [Sedimentisphaerales bacterium]